MSLPGSLLVITNRQMTRQPLPEVVEAAFAAGCRWVLVREKDLPRDELAALVAQLVDRARSYDAAVSVSTDAAVAAECGAYGVHLPRGCSVAQTRTIVGAALRIGVSAHSLDEARQAAASGADYITLSPIFLTESKPGYGPALGLAELQRIAAVVPIPVVALGGITAERAGACLKHGATGAAVMGSIMRAARPGLVVRELVAQLTDATAEKQTDPTADVRP